MDGSKLGNGRTIGSVKAAINKYGGGKINQVTNTYKKSLNNASNSEISSSKAQELHVAKNRINQINENRIIAESEINQAEFEILKAKKLVRELTSQIQESELRAKEFQKGKRVEELPGQEENDQYEEVVREVEAVKREISKIKLEIERAVEEKFRAEKEADAAGLRLEFYTSAADKLRKEIEEAKEEEVLVELAQIQAQKELAEIEAQKKKEEERYSNLMAETRKKIGALRDEIETMKYLEDILELTNSEVDVLQNELNLIKEMDSKYQRRVSLNDFALKTVTEDLQAARKELETIQAEGFQLMGSMDIIRIELINMTKEKGELEKKEAETEKLIKKMNSKLLRAKDTLEVARASEEKAKSMLPSLSLALENLKRDKEAVKKEEEKLKEETGCIRAEIQKIESENDLKEEKLQTVVKELEEVKISEANALEKLQTLVENTVKARASQTNSTITISKFEYEYLTGCAAGARETADKKVAAALAWAEALKASEREIKIETALVEREIEELKLEEEQEVKRMEELESTEDSETEQQQREINHSSKSLQGRRSIKDHDYSSTPVRQAKLRRSGSPATRRISTSTSLSMKRRRKVMLKIAKYFANEQIEDENSAPLKADTDN
ncbi:protein PLASTID MOVEMENT IMPAIRED 2-like [Chenopodium quinoa]|uniref:Protein PLASTID MOVEMENT IMPAIRED 2 n=1 Tax=Chenopodium quinoa TaxID=63459 RepID=A0A803M493_CHEQI|nr:protein PLASTID MOVEMENT IMPAIRED 2-like [Chenopodium quinoa]